MAVLSITPVQTSHVLDESTLGDAEESRSAESHGIVIYWHATDGAVKATVLDRELLVGRDPTCDVVDQNAMTSRRHARVAQSSSGWMIRDLGSKNGVFTDGKRTNEAPIVIGTILRAGGLLGVVAARQANMEPCQELVSGLWAGPTLRRVAQRAQLAAQSSLNIVLEAESGSGKERFARAVHDWSEVPGEFIPINCAALPSSLAEAELFGYQKGAFTGAVSKHAGYFRAARAGTLFLDEVLELPPAVQAKLLRAVECGQVVPLGSTQPVSVGARIVSACQIPMADAVRSDRIRADLFARLNGVSIRIPPLRERREDILPLFRHFMKKHVSAPQSLTAATAEALCLYDWPLNVRELEALAQRVIVFHGGANSLTPANTAGLLGNSRQTESGPKISEDRGWTELVAALQDKGGNVVRAAESLGISRQRAYRLIGQHPELDVGRLRQSARCKL